MMTVDNIRCSILLPLLKCSWKNNKQSGEVLDPGPWYFPDEEGDEDGEEDWVPKTSIKEERSTVVGGASDHWKSKLPPPFGIPLQSFDFITVPGVTYDSTDNFIATGKIKATTTTPRPSPPPAPQLPPPQTTFTECASDLNLDLLTH